MSDLAVTGEDLPGVIGQRRGMGLTMVLCFVLVGLVAVMAVVGPWLTPQDPSAQNVSDALAGPSTHHLLGTDALGRDVLSRVVAGAGTAVVGPLVIAAGSFLIGNALGLLAGYRGGWTDTFISRGVDLLMALPGLLVVIVAVGALGGGYWLAVALLIALTVPLDTRVVRAATLEQAPRPYVEAAWTVGVPSRRIMMRHIWPNVAPVALANTFLVFATSIVALSGLSFLGLGVSPGTADWGLMLAEGTGQLFANPVGVLAPAVMIVLTATCVNLIGDWLYERLSSRGSTW
jgi:peptide/nickel transport system permease protein